MKFCHLQQHEWTWDIMLSEISQGKTNTVYVCMLKLLQLCLTLCNSMDYNLPGSSIYGILQARILDWVAMPSSRGSSQPRDWTCGSCIVGGFFTAETNVMKKQMIIKIIYNLLDPVPGLLRIHFPTVWIKIWPKKKKERKKQEEHFRMRETSSNPKEI